MARILFTVQPGVGHLNPLVPLATALQGGGHEVRVATARGFGRVVESRGLAAVPAGIDWQQNAAEETFPGFLSFDGAEQLRVLAGQASPAMAADLVDFGRAWRPELVVRDNSEWGGWVAAEELGIPSVAYTVIGRVPAAALGPVIGPQLAGLRAARGLPADPELRTLDGALCLDTTPRSLQAFPGGPPDPRVVPVRPVFGDVGADDALPAWVTRPGEGPLVFATLGTVFHRNDPLLGKLLSAVADEPYRVLLAGADLPPGASVPPNVHVERYVPLSRTLPFCAAVVSHAGRGTTLTALGHGVPLLLLPLSAEQPMTAGPVERAGAGLVCATDEIRIGPSAFPLTDPARLDPQDIRARLRRLLREPSFGERARAIQAEIAALPGPTEVVALLERLLGGGSQYGTRLETLS